MHRSSRAGRTQRGNILFLILLAVVLFAALNYAVTSSMRGGGKDGSSENADAIAAQIIQHAANVEQAVTRLRLTNGCLDTQISFQNSIVSGYTNASTPADGRCKVFDESGGGLAWLSPPSSALVDQATANSTTKGGAGYAQYNISSQTYVVGVGTPDTGGTGVGKDLIIGLPYVDDDVCAAINKQLGLGVMAACPGCFPVGDPNVKFTGTYYSPGGYAAGFASMSKPFRTGCVPATNYTGNNFFHVILAR